VISPTELARARALFPHTTQGKVYLNHAGTGPLSTRVLAAMAAYLHERSEGTIDNYPADVEMVGRVRRYAQRLINAESPERITFQPNTSDALNVVASGISWTPGDRIILNDLEFPANVYPYLNLKRLGVELDVVGSRGGMITPDQIEKTLTPRTRLVALSAVQFLSGHRADLTSIGGLCRSRGVTFAVDGIQAVGAVALDVQAMKIDSLAAGSQKWQMGPHGTGFLYLTEELQSHVQQTNLGWLGVKDPWDFRNYNQALAPSARRYEGGSLNIPGLWGLEAALQTLLEFGIDAIEDQILGLTEILIEGFGEIAGVEILTPVPSSARAGIITIQLPLGLDQKRVFRRMVDKGLTAALREGKLRYSPHFYNTPEEMETAVEVTRTCLAHS
jgi:selenocysteine lyase/cysteine desulfurase